MQFARSLVIALVLITGQLPLSAHHAWPVNNSKLVTVKGTVTSVDWSNPHPMFGLEVRTAQGAVEKWSIGGPAIIRMEANGWTKATLSVGDVITGVGYQFADGQKILRLERIILPSGKAIPVYGR